MNFDLLFKKWYLGTQELFCKVSDQLDTRLNNYGLICRHTSGINCVNNCTFIFTRHQPRLFLKALLVLSNYFYITGMVVSMRFKPYENNLSKTIHKKLMRLFVPPWGYSSNNLRVFDEKLVIAVVSGTASSPSFHNALWWSKTYIVRYNNEMAAVQALVHKKKRTFLGLPAPLGYVPGLGRGWINLVAIITLMY